MIANANLVMCEKPLTPTAAEAEELFKIAKANKRILGVYQNRRWDGDFLTVQKLIKDNTVSTDTSAPCIRTPVLIHPSPPFPLPSTLLCSPILCPILIPHLHVLNIDLDFDFDLQLGPIVDITSCFDRYKPTSPSAELWKERAGEYNDALYNLGSHMIDQAIVLFGKPTRISCRSWPQRGIEGLDEAVSFQYRLSPSDHLPNLSPDIFRPAWTSLGEDTTMLSAPKW